MNIDTILTPHLKEGVELCHLKLEDPINVMSYSGPATYVLGFPSGRYYIGSTKRFRYRMAQHRSYLRGGKHINEKLQLEYVENNDVTVTYLRLGDKSDAALLEQKLLFVEYTNSACLNKTPSIRGMSDYDQTGKVAKLKAIFSTDDSKTRRSDNSKKMWANPEYRARFIAQVGQAVIVDGITYLSYREASRITGKSIAALRQHTLDGVVDTTKMKVLVRGVSCDGVIYPTIRVAATALGIAETTLHWRVNHLGEKWKDYHYLD